MRGRPIEPAHGKQHTLQAQRLAPYELGEDEPLSRRQLTIVFLASWGLDNNQTANMLGISKHTVNAHWKNILLKTGKHKRLDVVVKLIREGIMP